MNRFTSLAGFVVVVIVVSCLGAQPAFAVLCDVATNKSCTSIPPASTGGTIAGLVASPAGSWDGGDYDCSQNGTNGVVLTRITPVNLHSATPQAIQNALPHTETFQAYTLQRALTFETTGTQTTAGHYMEFRLVNPPTVQGVEIDIFMKVCPAPGPACNATPEVLLPNGTTLFDEIRVIASNLPSGTGSGAPALGTTFRIVLGLSVLAAALWLIVRRSS